MVVNLCGILWLIRRVINHRGGGLLVQFIFNVVPESNQNSTNEICTCKERFIQEGAYRHRHPVKLGSQIQKTGSKRWEGGGGGGSPQLLLILWGGGGSPQHLLILFHSVFITQCL